MNNNKILLLSENDVYCILKDKLSNILSLIEKAFIVRISGGISQPEKICQIFDEKIQNRINCMPATLINDNICGVKWVSVFPNNPLSGMNNVSALIILSEIKYGKTLSIMDGSLITSLRTAAVGALAAKYLAPKESRTIGFIGAGQEARKHLDMIKLVCPSINTCFVSSRTEKTILNFINEEQKHKDINFISCGNNYEKAVSSADIIITATSSQCQLLKAEYINRGSLYIHVGGLEDEYAVPLKAKKIVCDEWEAIKHRSQTISRMYKEGLLFDHNIYADLSEIISKNKNGRENNNEFIYFCSVGLPYIDVTIAKYVYDETIKRNIGTKYIIN